MGEPKESQLEPLKAPQLAQPMGGVGPKPIATRKHKERLLSSLSSMDSDLEAFSHTSLEEGDDQVAPEPSLYFWHRLTKLHSVRFRSISLYDESCENETFNCNKNFVNNFNDIKGN